MQTRLEALMAKIKELRQTIREKDFEIEDTKRVCMDIVQQKEAAYQALLDDMNKIRDDYDAYKKMLQQKFFEMGTEFKKQKNTYETTIANLEEELERERATHIIINELKAEIEKWKKKHQEEIDYREVLVKDLRETVEIKEKGIERLISDCNEYENRIKALLAEKETIQEKCEAKLSKHERSWLKKKHEWDKRAKELDLEIQKLVYNLNDPEKAKRMKEKAEAEKRYLQELKEKLETQQREIDAARIAVAEMAAENTDMRGLLGDRKAELGKDKEVLEKKMEQQNKRFKRLMVENEDLRKTLLAEMDRAEENLKDLEVQFLEMPNPFADEVAELRQGYDDNMKVVKELSKNNFELTEELAGVKAKAASTQDTLEKKLAFTIEMLEKVKEMETVKLIANPDILAALDADGDGDIEMDEALPIFQAQGMSYEEAVALFNRLDLSGDGTISADEFAAFKATL